MSSSQAGLRLDRLRQTSGRMPPGLIRDLAAGSLRLTELKARPGNCRVVRVFSDDGGSVIVKMWNRPGLRGLLRRLSGTAPHQREASCLERLWDHGVTVPAPIGVMRVSEASLPYTDALVLQDLGECEIALDHVKALVRGDKQSELDLFLGRVVELTAGMVDAGVIDRDHSFLNIVAQPDGVPARLDLEIAESSISAGAFGEMLGRLVATLVFALQPDAKRAGPFVAALVKRIAPPPDVIDVAMATVTGMLEYQRRNGGPDTHIELPWR